MLAKASTASGIHRLLFQLGSCALQFMPEMLYRGLSRMRPQLRREGPHSQGRFMGEALHHNGNVRGSYPYRMFLGLVNQLVTFAAPT